MNKSLPNNCTCLWWEVLVITTLETKLISQKLMSLKVLSQTKGNCSKLSYPEYVPQMSSLYIFLSANFVVTEIFLQTSFSTVKRHNRLHYNNWRKFCHDTKWALEKTSGYLLGPILIEMAVVFYLC